MTVRSLHICLFFWSPEVLGPLEGKQIDFRKALSKLQFKSYNCKKNNYQLDEIVHFFSRSLRSRERESCTCWWFGNILSTPPKFNIAPEKLPSQWSSSNHHFSGVNSLLNFGGVSFGMIVIGRIYGYYLTQEVPCLKWHIWKTNLSWAFREFARHLRSFRFLLCQKALYISKVLLSFALPLLLSTFQIWAPRSKLESGQLCGTCEMPSWWQKSMKYTWIHLSMARWWFQIIFFKFSSRFFWGGTCHHFDTPHIFP